MTKPALPRDRTTNWHVYSAALRQRGSLLIWSDPEMDWLGAPRGKRGRPATFPDAAIRACLTLKELFGRLRCGRRPGWWRARLEAGQAGLACARS